MAENRAMPVLYSFRRCPYAMRARLALLVSGQACEIREVKLSAKPAELLAASAKATVPVLMLSDGRVIDESLDVMRWALERNDPERWLDGDDAELIAANDGPFKHALDRTKYPERHVSDPKVHRAQGLAFLATLEARLATNPNLCGAAMTLADAAILPFVRQFAAIDRAWFATQPLPAVQAWLAWHLASPLFETAMIRLAPWQRGDAPVIFAG
jgi:glutathione S-transferase